MVLACWQHALFFSKKKNKQTNKHGSGTLLLARRVFSLGMSWARQTSSHFWEHAFRADPTSREQKKHVKTHVNTRTDARYAGETHRKKRAWCSRAGKTHFSKKLKKKTKAREHVCSLRRSQFVPKAFPRRSQGVPRGQPTGRPASISTSPRTGKTMDSAAKSAKAGKRRRPRRDCQQKHAKGDDPDETVSKNTQNMTILTRLSAKTCKK